MNCVELIRAAAWFTAVAFAQPGASHISGTLVNNTGAPLGDTSLRVEAQHGPRTGAAQAFKSGPDGTFTFLGEPGMEYAVYATGTVVPEGVQSLGKIVAAKGRDIDLGRIVVQFVSQNRPSAKLAGPAKSSPPPAKGLSSIAAIFVEERSAVIIRGDGTLVRIPMHKEQVDASSLSISGDGSAAGWLVDSWKVCCVSYPLALELEVYQPGRKLATFSGDGRAIFEWSFLNDGKRFVFLQEFPHGDPVPHYELHDTASGRLLDKCDGAPAASRRKWTAILQR